MHRSFALGQLWNEVKPKLLSKGLMGEGKSVKLGNGFPNGTLIVTDGEDLWELFSVQLGAAFGPAHATHLPATA
eukprot:12764098-Alexandrium_andersonii.AAC.1